MTLYNWLLFGHVLFAIIWVGGGIITQIYATRAARADDPMQLMGLLQQVAWAGNTVFMPSSFLVLGFGIGLVLTGRWEFESLWIVIGFAGFLATAITGMAVLGPRGKKIAALAAEKGPTNPEVLDRARKLIKLQRIDLVVLVLVVLDMTLKPGAVS